MYRIKHLMAVLTLLIMAGCASTPSLKEADAGRSVTAGSTTFVEVPSGHGSSTIMAYGTPGKPVCARCESTAVKYFDTGKLDRDVCDVCGAKITVGHGQPLAMK